MMRLHNVPYTSNVPELSHCLVQNYGIFYCNELWGSMYKRESSDASTALNHGISHQNTPNFEILFNILFYCYNAKMYIYPYSRHEAVLQ